MSAADNRLFIWVSDIYYRCLRAISENVCVRINFLSAVEGQPFNKIPRLNILSQIVVLKIIIGFDVSVMRAINSAHKSA
jgi:hypothetical protein